MVPAPFVVVLERTLARSRIKAMATATKVSYPHIVKEPGYCGGKAAIDHTRVRVADVVAAHQRGQSPEQILETYEHLTLSQVHAALAYYYDNRDEIDEIFAREDADEARALPGQIVRVP
jgi:uncharacterized protein (DUF433 family)